MPGGLEFHDFLANGTFAFSLPAMRAPAAQVPLPPVKRAVVFDRLLTGATVGQDRKRPRKSAGTPRLQDTVRLSAEGLAKVLGDLESRVLRAVWDFGKPAPARAVHECVARSHAVAPLTVITVLNKLVAKGLLVREKQDDLFHYRASMSEAEFTARASRRVVEGILSLAPGAVAASLVDVLAERDRARLEELGRLVRRRLRETDAE